MMKHPKKTAAAVGVAAILPFILGVDAGGVDVHGFFDPAFWQLVAKAIGASLGSAAAAALIGGIAAAGSFAKAFGASRKQRGERKLEDGDPTNDTAGELDIDIGQGLIALGNKLDPPERPSNVIALPAPAPSSPPDPTKPPKSAA